MSLSFDDRFGARMLFAAAVLVGFAIALDGAAAKAINGVAGIAWFVAAATLLRATLRLNRGQRVLAIAFGVALVLVLLVKPSDLAWAAIGFTVGGAIVSVAARAESLRSALILPALWLPVHLLVAIVRVAERAIRDLPATVRTDPPPTAALVPLAMVVAAWCGAWAMATLRERRFARAHRATA